MGTCLPRTCSQEEIHYAIDNYNNGIVGRTGLGEEFEGPQGMASRLAREAMIRGHHYRPRVAQPPASGMGHPGSHPDPKQRPGPKVFRANEFPVLTVGDLVGRAGDTPEAGAFGAMLGMMGAAEEPEGNGTDQLMKNVFLRN